MHNTLPLSVFIVFLSCIHSGLQASDCKDVNYTTINDPRRSTAYTKTTNLCDVSLLIRDNGWYRFASEAGGEIPTKIPKAGSCGTFIPIWMNGSHPSVEEGAVNRTACAAPPFSIVPCVYSHTIKVRNCSGFYIYQLKRPKECFSAYCAGSILPNCTNARPGDHCLENRPPYITMPKRLYAFEKSEFHLFFNATDPEGYPLGYDYHPNTTINNISIDEKQKITISRTKSGIVVLRVRDEADKRITSTHTIEIVAVPCSCRQNRGTYKSNITVSTKREDLKYTCSCDKPYTGQLCEISPCDKFPCFPGVNCTVADDYKCEKCPSRFEGDGKKCKISEDTVVVEGEFTIISGLKWQAGLLNKTSFLYKQQTAKIVTKIMEIYRDTEEFVHVVITDYKPRKGSVVVYFQIVFNKKINDPLKLLRARLTGNSGTWGSFKVDTNSVKEKKRSDDDDDSYFGLHKTVFIVVVCLVSILALTAIVVCAICIKKKHISIIILSTNENRREIVHSSSNGNVCSQKKKPSRNQVMDLQSTATSTCAS